MSPESVKYAVLGTLKLLEYYKDLSKTEQRAAISKDITTLGVSPAIHLFVLSFIDKCHKAKKLA